MTAAEYQKIGLMLLGVLSFPVKFFHRRVLKIDSETFWEAVAATLGWAALNFTAVAAIIWGIFYSGDPMTKEYYPFRECLYVFPVPFVFLAVNSLILKARRQLG